MENVWKRKLTSTIVIYYFDILEILTINHHYSRNASFISEILAMEHQYLRKIRFIPEILAMNGYNIENKYSYNIDKMQSP